MQRLLLLLGLSLRPSLPVRADADHLDCVDLGVALRFVGSSFAKLIDDVTLDRCDIAMFGIGITPARAEKLRVTRAHLLVGTYAITTRNQRRIKDWPDIDQPGVAVAVLKDTVHQPVMRERLKAATLVVVDNARARELEVHSGRADVFIANFLYGCHKLEPIVATP